MKFVFCITKAPTYLHCKIWLEDKITNFERHTWLMSKWWFYATRFDTHVLDQPASSFFFFKVKPFASRTSLLNRRLKTIMYNSPSPNWCKHIWNDNERKKKPKKVLMRDDNKKKKLYWTKSYLVSIYMKRKNISKNFIFYALSIESEKFSPFFLLLLWQSCNESFANLFDGVTL